MRITQKVTVWREIEISDEVSEEELIDTLRSNDPYTNILWENGWVSNSEFMLDTEEDVGIDENVGFSTIELYNDNNEIIWQNGRD